MATYGVLPPPGDRKSEYYTHTIVMLTRIEIKSNRKLPTVAVVVVVPD